MNDTTYNGWHNYPTWRINLEYFDGWDIRDEYRTRPDARDLADYLKDRVEEYIEEGTENITVKGWAHAFANQVNYHEIAEHLIENAEYEEEEDD